MLKQGNEIAHFLRSKAPDASANLKIGVPLALPVLTRYQHNLNLHWESQWHTTQRLSSQAARQNDLQARGVSKQLVNYHELHQDGYQSNAS